MFLLVSLSIFCINTKKSKVNLDNNVRISETINEESSENTANDSYECDESNDIDLYHGSCIKLIDRTIEYPDDESSSFSDAEIINYGVAYDRMFNYNYDYDYFFISVSSDGLYTFDIDVSSTLIIYQHYPLTNSPNSTMDTVEIMRYNSITTSNVIFLMGNYDYYLVVRPNVLYTGAYCFELSYLTNNFSNYFLKTNYINGSLNNMEVIYRDYSLQSNSGLKIGYVPATCDIEIHNVEEASTSRRHYFGFSDDRIYDVNHYISLNYENDDRYITRTSDYPGMCVVYLNSECINGNLDNFSGSGFLVASNAIMTAAHVVTSHNTNGGNYMNSVEFFIKPFMTSSNGPQGVVSFYAQTMYYPLSYYTQTVQKENDWCIIVFDGDVEEPYGYLGLSFGNDSVINLHCMGYPALGFIYPHSYQYEIQLTYSSGNFTPTNNLYISNEVDISHRNSGGPCFYESNGLYYVRCIVSSDYDNYVAYSKINKVNYNLLMEVIE